MTTSQIVLLLAGLLPAVAFAQTGSLVVECGRISLGQANYTPCPPLYRTPVVIEIVDTITVACEPPRRAPVRREDGTYSQPFGNQMLLTACYATARRFEEWTDRPENGGKFIRVIPKGDLQ